MQKNTAQDFTVAMYASGVPTAPTGALTLTVSKDGGGFAAAAGSATQVAGTPAVLIEAAAADMNCDSGCFLIVDGGGTADDRYIEFVTEANYTAARIQEIHARTALGVVTDESAGTIKVYDGNDPTTANLLFTLTRTVVGDTYTYTRS